MGRRLFFHVSSFYIEKQYELYREKAIVMKEFILTHRIDSCIPYKHSILNWPVSFSYEFHKISCRVSKVSDPLPFSQTISFSIAIPFCISIFLNLHKHPSLSLMPNEHTQEELLHHEQKPATSFNPCIFRLKIRSMLLPAFMKTCLPFF